MKTWMSQRYSYVYFLSFQKVENSQERHDRIIRWYENMHSESLCALSRLGRISEFTSRRLKRQLQQILTKISEILFTFFSNNDRNMRYPTKRPPLKYNRNFSRIKMANFAGDNLNSPGTGWIALEFSRRSENAFCESLFRQEIISSTLAEALSLGKVKNSSWIF